MFLAACNDFYSFLAHRNRERVNERCGINATCTHCSDLAGQFWIISNVECRCLNAAVGHSIKNIVKAPFIVLFLVQHYYYVQFNISI